MTVIKHLVFPILFLVTISANAQHGILRKDGKILYESTVYSPKTKKKDLAERVLSWIEKDSLFTLNAYDEKKGTVNAGSKFSIPTQYRRNQVDFHLLFTMEKNLLKIQMTDFYLPEIDLTLDEFFTRHKGKKNELLAETIRYLASGIHAESLLFMERISRELGPEVKQ